MAQRAEQPEKKRFDFRKVKIGLCCFMMVGLFGIVIYRLFMIQVAEREFYLKKLHRQYETTFTNPVSMRGEIYDRNGVELAVSVLTYSVYVNKGKIKDVTEFCREMAKYTRVRYEEIRKRLQESDTAGVFLFKKMEDRSIKSALLDLKKEKKQGVSDAFEIMDDAKRFYPYKEMASHVIGFTNDENEGLEGIEYFYDRKMRGAVEKVSYNNSNAEGFLKKHGGGAKGSSLVLTIDKNLQAVVEEELKKGIARTHGKSGFAVVMDPETGEIVSLASYPDYDPNKYSVFTPSSRRNRAVTDIMEPGSVMKVFIAASALEEGVVGPNTKINCEQGRYRVHDRVFNEAHSKKYGILSMREVIKYSSNIGSIKIGEKLGRKRMNKYLTDFGFGKKTELGFPGEGKGVVPTARELTPVRLSTVSFGQGVSVTPVQIAAAFSAVVNGGYLLKPYLVKKMLNEGNQPVWENQKEIVKRVISGKTSDAMKHILRDVVTGGTGHEAALDEVAVMGKTGTAQKPGKHGYQDIYLASFVGGFPADAPKYVIYVGIDSPQGITSGGYVAAPIFREIAKRIVELKGEEKRFTVYKNEQGVSMFMNKKSAAYNNLSSRFEHSGIPDLRGLTLREALRVASMKKIDVDVSGTGVVYSQSIVNDGRGNTRRKIVINLR